MIVLLFMMQAATISHTDCLRKVSTALETSGESANDVASATVTECASNQPPDAVDGLLATMTPDQQMATLRLQRELERDRITLRIVRLRACRKTAGCDLQSLLAH